LKTLNKKLKNQIYFFLLIIINMSVAMAQPKRSDKIVVYQIMTRVFSNQNVNNKFNGSKAQNGVGKFNDINNNALISLKNLGISHVWYTGVIEHATLTDYTKYGIPNDHPQIVKGLAGSPYAIKDYYDVNPDLAVNVNKRMQEFEALVIRTHNNKLKLIIDFVPNHLARQYKSDKKPKSISDFGELDDKNDKFNNQNNFYYLPGSSLVIPKDVNPLVSFKNQFSENPPKATGNDVFSAEPNINDWYETIKLNYGVDIQNGGQKNFDPIPNTWLKMKDILSFWAKKGVDGFRCDMAEMVPVEFWGWVIPQIKTINPEVIFIAEIYNPAQYSNFIFTGKFDYLYDKVGLYDALRRLIEGHGNTNDISKVWQNESGEFSNRMLRFLENHDEQRITADEFGKTPESGFAAMMLSATLHTGPVMVYYGQELGVKPTKAEGFQGNDGRTTIFDYWGLEELQGWIKDGKFDEKQINKNQKTIRDFYKKTLLFAQKTPAVSKGAFFDLQYLNQRTDKYNSTKQYSYLRHFGKQVLLFVYNFDKENETNTQIKLPKDFIENILKVTSNEKLNFKEVFYKKEVISKSLTEVTNTENSFNGLNIKIAANSFKIYEITKP
jgi:glycosidase